MPTFTNFGWIPGAVGPRGPQGPRGEPGEEGRPGRDGKDADLSNIIAGPGIEITAVPPNQILISSTLTPAGTTGQIQFNDNGAFGASPNLFWDIPNQRLGIHTTTPGASIHCYTFAATVFGNDPSGYLYWTPEARLGVGTYEPLTKLHVQGLAADPSLTDPSRSAFLMDLTGLQIRFGQYSTPPFNGWIQAVATAAQTGYALVINPLGGNVGINTLNPLTDFTLDVNGLVHLGFSIGNGAGISYDSPAGTDQWFLGSHSINNYFRLFSTDRGDDVLRVLTTGPSGFVTLILPFLPNSPAGVPFAGLWYDPADGNVVKFVT